MESARHSVSQGPRSLSAAARALALAPFYFALLTLFAVWPWRFGSPFFLTRPLRLPEAARRASVLRLFAFRLYLREKRLLRKKGRRLLSAGRLNRWLRSPWTETIPQCASATRREMERTGESGAISALSVFCTGWVDSYRYANGTVHRDWFDHERRPNGAFHVPNLHHIRSCCYLLNHRLNPEMPLSQRHYDKAEFYEICRDHQLPTVPVYAVFDSGQMQLRAPVPDVSLFSKPSNSAEGRGEFLRWSLVTERSRETPIFRTPDGEATDLEGIIKHLEAKSRAEPYLLQRRMTDHESIRALSGAETLCTLRIPTCRFPDGRVTVLPFALFKMPTTPEALVNTGAKGAVIYPVQLETGRLAPGVIRGRNEFFDVQPTSGRKATGFEIPLWSEALELCRAAHSDAFPTFPTVGWDVAITREGPVLVEMNIQWLRPAGVPGEEFTGRTEYIDCILAHMSRLWPEQLPLWATSATDSPRPSA